jgi:hypothetical protein
MNIEPHQRDAFAILFNSPVGQEFRRLARMNPPRANRAKGESIEEFAFLAEGWHLLVDVMDQVTAPAPRTDPIPQFVNDRITPNAS